MVNVNHLAKIFLVVCLSHAPAFAQTTSQPASTPTTSPPAQDPAVAQANQQIDQVIYSERFSHAIPQTKWEEKNPKQPDSNGFWEKFWRWVSQWFKPSMDNGSDIGVTFGTILKGMLLLALLGGVVWLLLQYETWLPWLKGRAIRPRQRDKARVNQLDTPLPTSLWQGLPDSKSHFVEAVRQALHAKNWLLALSLLYRGTLREVLQVHELPITHASTEQQCAWLLDQAQYKQPHEAEYFQQLVALWSQMAYSKAVLPAQAQADFAQRIEQLLTTWQTLYMHAQRPPKKIAFGNQVGAI